MSFATMIARVGQTLSHQRPNDKREPGGGRRREWTTLASSVACWKQPATPRVVEQWAAKQTAIDCSVFVAQDLGAQAEDRLVLSDGTTVLVAGQRDLAGLGRGWRIDGKELV